MNVEKIKARIRRYKQANIIYLVLLTVLVFGIFVDNSNLVIGCAVIFNMVQNELLYNDYRDLEEEILDLKKEIDEK